MNRILREQFAAQGFVAPVRLLAHEAAATYRASLQSFIDRHGADRRFADWTYLKSHLLLSWVAKLAMEPAVLDAVEEILGPNLVLWDSFVPVKKPGSSGYFGWHQDGTYWSIAPLDQVVTVWVALGDVSGANGAMKMIPGSHRWGPLEHEKSYDASSMLRRGQRIASDLDAAAEVTIALAPGEASVHGAWTVHGSEPNRSDRWRLAVALTYVSGTVGPLPGHAESGVVLRGSGSGRLHAETLAQEDVGPAEIREYERVTLQSSKRYADIQSPA